MAVYKVIQDVEAEDHILGPLTLRQFIYALVCALFLYINFLCLVKGAAFLIVLFLPPALLSGFFAFPFKQDQPTEVWAIAKVRFLFKPRNRVWNQSEMKSQVTITVPKKEEKIYTNSLTPNEVHSRLKTLAEIIDTRGWALKNSDLSAQTITPTESDRLINPYMPKPVPDYDVEQAKDILDDQGTMTSRFGDMLSESTKQSRDRLLQKLQGIRKQGLEPVISDQPVNLPSVSSAPVPVSNLEGQSEDTIENSLEEGLKNQNMAIGNLHTLRMPAAATIATVDTQQPTINPTYHEAVATKSAQAPEVSDAKRSVILRLAQDSNRSVSSLSKEANEVIIDLHK